jgi:uncharacterized repeat protein (TIGR01451 family)
MVDARVNLPESFKRAAAARPEALKALRAESKRQKTELAAAYAKLKQRLPGLEVKISGVTGAPSSVRNRRGALTAAAPGRKSADVVRGFLTDNGALYGLSATDVDDLVALGDSPGGGSGLRMLRMEQRIDGRPIFQSETRFLLDRDGRLMKSVGRLVPHARSSAPQLKASHLLTPSQAVVDLLAAEGKTADPAAFTVASQTSDGRIQLAETDAFVAGEVTARQVLFPLAQGLLVPAWSLVVFTEGDEDWYAMVDAETGALLWRKNIRDSISAHDARFRVYVQADGITPADSPAPQSPNTVTTGSGTQFAEIAPTIVSMHAAMDATASPNGWIDDCPGGVCATVDTNTSSQQTLGNNVKACMDRTVGGANTNVCDTDAASQLDGFGKPTGNPDSNGRNRDFLGTAPRDFQTNFTPPPQGGAANAEVGQTATGAGNGTSTGPTDIFRRGVVTHLFYVANWYHDQLFKLGFDEPSANFQLANFQGLGGLGGDRVNADAQDGSGTNNANFSTPPDGTSGRAQMFRFTGPTIDRDGDLDQEVLMHELTHGTSNRLVGNAAGLNWDPAGGMGEGWSDFYALSLLNNTNADTPTAHFAAGAYATYKLIAGYLDNYLYGIRRFPYTTDNSVNPMTWADVDDVSNDLSGGIAPSPVNFNGNGGFEVHNIGEIWALTLWEVRSRVIADPAGANGDVPTGNHTMLQLTTDALKMTPIDPSFIDARDAFFDADCATNGCANEDSIWGGFADRGLGYGASVPYNISIALLSSHMGVHESFSLPFLDVVNPSTDATIDDSSGNNNGAIDPGEPIKMTVKLTNPWRGASKAVASVTSTLTTSTPGVTIFDNASTYGAIAPQGSATGDSFLFTVDSSVLCGSAIDFTLTTVSSLGTTATSFRVRIGAASGTDPVVTYTDTVAPPLAIPDNRSRGAFHQMTVTDDFEIADLDFRVDSLTHTFVDDLVVLLRAPNGVGVDMISLIGLNSVDGGSADNLTNMVIDDDLPFVDANDMIQALNADAPFSRSWVPVYNSPSWADPGFFGLAGDPVGSLTRFDGMSTKGTWTALVADEFAGDTGTLNSWSILVTPVHRACAAFAPAALVPASKSVSGTFSVGGTVTYTVVLTNNGTDGQGDNAGHEFTDTLPAGLTLVSATATSGTATANSLPNLVTWDGTLAPLGGSVTITITATVNAGTQGTTITNQGATSYDSNNDNVNDASQLTDDPAVGGATDPTSFVVAASSLTATKTAAGSFKIGSNVVYTITISNGGSAASPDNAGHELTDVLPAGLTLVSATASAGTAVATIGTNTVDWDGSVPAAGSVTITITATITGAIGSNISNQGTVSFDADLNGSNETTVQTDDPAVGGAADPTVFQVQPAAIAQVPTVSPFGLTVLALGLLAAAWSILRRRKTTA